LGGWTFDLDYAGGQFGDVLRGLRPLPDLESIIPQDIEDPWIRVINFVIKQIYMHYERGISLLNSLIKLYGFGRG
jgi:hypothetical protein